MKWFIHCAILEKEGVGEVHVHKRWWSRKVSEAFYIPEGSTTMHPVPLSKFNRLTRCTTVIEAMALIRQEKGSE